MIGGGSDELMDIEVEGVFEPDTGAPARPFTSTLITEFQAGDVIRYVLDEEDALGQNIDLRTESGTVRGEFTAYLRQGAHVVVLPPIMASFRIEPVRHIVQVVFNQGFTDVSDLASLTTG